MFSLLYVVALIATVGALPIPDFASTTTTVTTNSTTTSDTTNTTTKYVVAHHMVGNTFPYTIEDWAEDIQLAHDSGIDAFALNVGSDDWQPQRIADAYKAASQSNTTFKLFLSLDMAVNPCSSDTDAQKIRSLVQTYLNHPSQFLFSNPSSPGSPPRAFVSTFSGSSCQFGQANAATGWTTQFVNHPDLQGKIHFVPAFFVDPKELGPGGQFDTVVDGDFNWNSGWPIQLTTALASSLESNPTSNNGGIINSAVNAVSNTVNSVTSSVNSALSKFVGSIDTDLQHLSAIGETPSKRRRDATTRKTYMAAVSPWFFTHYGKDTFDKNFIYLSDDHLYASRWEALLSPAVHSSVDIVELVTWNDFGESSYIGKIKGALPPGGTEGWVDGMDHTGWLQLTSYYAKYFKTGSPPQVENDTIVMWARPHPVNAQAQGDSVGPPDNFQLTQDAMWAVVLAKEPCTVTLSTSAPTTSNSTQRRDDSSSGSSSQTFNLPAGLSKLSLPLSPGSGMYARLDRNGTSGPLVEVNPTQFVFGSGVGVNGTLKTLNFNAFVASGTGS